MTALRILVLGCTLISCAASAADALEQGFRAVPDSAKPWVYWWWHNGNVNEASITRDLEQMKAKGIGGLLMFDSRGYHDNYLPPPAPKNEFLDPQWRKLLKFAVSEANRLGLRMSMNLSTHAGSLYAPWKTGGQSPKKLVWTSFEVSGPGRVTRDLRPGGGIWNVALLAVRRTSQGPRAVDGWQPVVTALKSGAPAASEVVDLTSAVEPGGRFSWNAPAGDWTLLRFAYMLIPGHENGPDVLSAAAVEDYFRRMAGPILKDAGPLAGKALTHFYSVSWEGASPTWTPGFDEEFLKYRRYRLTPFLPVLAGITVRSPEQSARFLADYSRTLSDCFLNNCYGRLRALTRQAGLEWHAESGGPWQSRKHSDLLFQHADQFEYWARNDMPQGEFWPSGKADAPPEATRGNCSRTAMAGHIYGQRVIAAEAFTHMLSHWIMYPARLKPAADQSFIDGVNQLVWHTFSASPPEFGVPGIVYWAGTHLNPNVTWWEQAGAFLDYLGRCQFMLRQGRFVADAVVYASDRNNIAWDHGKRWSESPSLTLGGGYKFDVISKEALLERLSFRNGRLVLPDGMSYGLLVLDLEEDAAAPEVLDRILSLADAGATVVLGRRRPVSAPGLTGYPACDTKVRRLADRLWKKGMAAGNSALDEIVRKKGIAPDFEGPFQFTHRRSETADIYFLLGEGSAECTFRVDGREPELWDPITGRAHPTAYRRIPDGRTAAAISLPKNGSVFVVFRPPSHHVKPAPPQPEPRTLPLAGPWEVHFAPGWGAPEHIVFDRLIPWNEHPQDGIKYFSGSATYRRSIQLSAAQARQPARLKLGEVRMIASVRLNGKPLAVVWTDPWTVDLTGALKPGRNELEIRVTNVWVNRLIGDASLPEARRFTKTHVRREGGRTYPRPNLAGYLATDPLLRSGLMGPVAIEFGPRHGIGF